MTKFVEGLEEVRPRRFQPYPEYKSSGVEWLGKIPVGWEVNRLRATVTGCQNGVWGDEADEVHDLNCVRVADFDRVQFRVRLDAPTTRSIDPRLAQIHRLEARDLLIEKSGGGDKQPVGAVVMYDHGEPAVCSNFVARMPVADNCDPRYVTYLHAALYAVRINTRSIKQSTGIQNLDSASYLNEPVGLPREREQRAIAAFLDGETAKIDALVAQKERLIELLQEKRTALITRAVTRGLDPNVSMKDSGVEWLGEIPAHWEVKRLKHLTPSTTVGIVVTPSKYYVDEGIPCLRSLNVSRGVIDLENLVFISEDANEFHRKSKIFVGDLVVVRTGQAGTAAIVPKELDGANCIDLLIVRRSQEVLSELVYYYLNSRTAISQATEQSVGAIQAHYNTSTLAQLIVPKIPPDEQSRIVMHLDKATEDIDRLITKVQEAIDHLKEFRTALISAAVTGRIDVRGDVAEATVGHGETS